MAKNIEVKTKIASIEALLPLACALADQGPLEVQQDDTFFPCERGRLKLRTLSSDRGQFVFYQRPDTKEPSASLYVIAETATPDDLREVMTCAFGASGRVIKRRIAFMCGRTRIYLDRVEGLGDYMELEVIMKDGEPDEAGIKEAHDILAQLGIPSEAHVAVAYVDLLKEKERQNG